MGSGFKDWAAGDVLTAADVDGYLMRQTVMTFADASARDTALSGVLDEGMVAYLEDTDLTTYYTGSAWVAQPRNAYIGSDTDSSYTLTNSSTQFLRVDATFPATNRRVRLDYVGTIDNMDSGGRIVSFSVDYSLDGGSNWTTQTYTWFLSYGASDVRSVSFWIDFTTSGNTSVSARVRASKSSGATGDLVNNRLLVTDIGAA